MHELAMAFPLRCLGRLRIQENEVLPCCSLFVRSSFVRV